VSCSVAQAPAKTRVRYPTFLQQSTFSDIEVDIVDAKTEDEDGSRLLQSSLSKSDLVSKTGMPPYPPGEEEQTFYYHGLPSRPKLVARSSGFRWQRQFIDQHETRKVLKNIGDHPIVDQYNDNVIKDIINVLGDLPWNAIDVLRIGYDFEDPTKYPVILWVSVQPGSTTWDKGYQYAIECTVVLRKYNIPDVECEIKEAEIFNLAGPGLLELKPQDFCLRGRLPFTQTLGQSLSQISQLEREGSMGLYLKQNNANKYFGLTCRHCVFLNTNDEAYSWNNSQPRRRIIQPGDATFKKLKKENNEYIEYWSDQVLHRGDLETATQELGTLQETKEFLESFAKLDNRVIGHVFFSPPHSLHHLKGWLRDWALIELDAQKFGDKPPINIVYIGDISDTIEEKLNARPPGFHFKMGGNKSLKLQDYIREDEIMHPTMRDENDEPCLIVEKRGRSTGVTWGTANEVMSVTRDSPVAVTSKEWCVLSSISKPFSQKGDSGSVVFDLKGRIAGIMSSGMGITDSTDTTYMTPMDWLLSDIKEQLKEPIHIC
jgi:hypothetical protein